MRGALRLLWSLRLRGLGLTLITTDRWTLAEELWSFGEDSLYAKALEMSDEEMVRLWRLAGRLYLKDKAHSAGEAAALAAVAVIEAVIARSQATSAPKEPPPVRRDSGGTVCRDLADRRGESFPETWR
jgi:hypothetical protein